MMFSFHQCYGDQTADGRDRSIGTCTKMRPAARVLVTMAHFKTRALRR
jgi:hypothetical protein